MVIIQPYPDSNAVETSLRSESRPHPRSDGTVNSEAGPRAGLDPVFGVPAHRSSAAPAAHDRSSIANWTGPPAIAAEELPVYSDTPPRWDFAFDPADRRPSLPAGQ